MQNKDLATLLDPGPQATPGAFRVHVLARIVARAERRRAWRKSAGYLAVAAAIGLIGPAANALELPPQFAPVAAVIAGLALAMASAPALRRLPRLRI